MCGIAGYLGVSKSQEDSRAILKQMCGALAHRGPDDEGFYIENTVALGMRRLSIIDLPGGHQPITDEAENGWTVFNGEIYNYPILREALQKKGHRFITSADTEVIVHQYEEDGEDCVKRFNGMFAFALWDKAKQSLFIARDRMGIKPLYYYSDGTQFFFASEIKALLASMLVPHEIDPKAVWDYLTLRYVPQPKTIWKNIFKLLPGHTLTVSRHNPVPIIRRYWDIPYKTSVTQKTWMEYTREFSTLFLDAVRIHLAADVPVGVLLSGGLDSSAVAAAIKDVHKAPLNSFSVAFKDSPHTNELPYARHVAQHVGMKHHEILIGEKDFINFLPRHAYFMDEPLADLACIPLYYVSHLAAQSVKVVMSGEGSDETLGGYDFDRVLKHWDHLQAFQNLPAWVRSIAGSAATVLGPKAKSYFDKAGIPLAQLFAADPPRMTDLFSSEEKRALFKSVPEASDTVDDIRNIMKRVADQEPLHQVLYQYCQSWLVDDLLMKADRMTMANSIELRVPFLDYRLVEWLAQTPSWIKVGKDARGRYTTKRILREFAASRLPEEILSRPKQGFPVPVYEWLTGPLKSWAIDLLGSSGTRLNSLFMASEVQRCLNTGISSTSTLKDRHKLWQLLILEVWMREWKA